MAGDGQMNPAYDGAYRPHPSGADHVRNDLSILKDSGHAIEERPEFSHCSPPLPLERRLATHNADTLQRVLTCSRLGIGTGRGRVMVIQIFGSSTSQGTGIVLPKYPWNQSIETKAVGLNP